jgi:polyphosphate kinase 2
MSQFLVTDESLAGEIESTKLLHNDDLKSLKKPSDLKKRLQEIKRDISGIEFNIDYEDQLEKLQIELIKLQNYVMEQKIRVAVIFEGRDAAGKGGAIKRFQEHLNPRAMRVVALSKPTDLEKSQWYFRRYIRVLPNAGEIVFFDRSWYNRAVVEPVMGFCSEEQYQRFMRQVPEFEHMLFEDGILVIKFWFSISKEEQKRRFAARRGNPLKQWKLSPVDERGQELWDKYTYYKEQMFSRTHTSFSPWIIVKTNVKKEARLESIRYLLSQFEYPDKDKALTRVLPDPNVIMRFHRSIYHLD